ncbi:MAG: ferritin-like domain-containing protein [Nocardioidaceae bacterium]
MNFALNLEYLEAEFYSYAYFGHGLDARLTTGRGRPWWRDRWPQGELPDPATSRTTRRRSPRTRSTTSGSFAAALGSAKVSRPAIDIKNSFTAAARAAGLIGPKQTFDPYANENNFLLAAFIFEDVGVTAYKGAAPLIDNKTYLDAAAGILAVEAYHAGIIRTNLYAKDLHYEARQISWARDSLDGRGNDDWGIGTPDYANLTPTDKNAIAFSRTPQRVLNVVYLTDQQRREGGFFPQGVNGSDQHQRRQRLTLDKEKVMATSEVVTQVIGSLIAAMALGRLTWLAVAPNLRTATSTKASPTRH